MTRVLSRTLCGAKPAKADAPRAKGTPTTGVNIGISGNRSSPVAGAGEPGSTVKGALSPAPSVSYRYGLALITTPDSATEYVTPTTVQELVPVLMVQKSVPPSPPVPALSSSCTPRPAGTLNGAPVPSCAWMATLKATPTVGSVPPLTLVMTRRCGGDAGELTVNGALVPAASASVPLVWVAVTLTPASGFE